MSEVSEKVSQKLSQLAGVIEAEVEIESDVSDDRLYLNIKGPDHGLFYGHRGEMLRDLSFLMQTYCEKSFPDADTEVKVDANGMVLGKENELRNMALEALAALNEPGDEVALGPLNSYERRIVHLTLQDKEQVETASQGEGSLKRVIVRLRAEPEAGDGESA